MRPESQAEITPIRDTLNIEKYITAIISHGSLKELIASGRGIMVRTIESRITLQINNKFLMFLLITLPMAASFLIALCQNPDLIDRS